MYFDTSNRLVRRNELPFVDHRNDCRKEISTISKVKKKFVKQEQLLQLTAIQTIYSLYLILN